MDGEMHAQRNGDRPAPGERWADAIQDGTLQSLAALRLQLAMGIRDSSPAGLERAAVSALEQIDDEIAGLRALLSEMRTD